MKIIIMTQHRENYGAHDWDGEGSCPQYWKYKGGSTYILEGVTVEQAQNASFWESLEDNVTSRSEYFEEYILYSFLEDDIVPNSNFHESWESPIMLALVDGRLIAKRIIDGHTYGYASHIVEKREQWVQVAGEQDEYSSVFVTDDGKYVDWQGKETDMRVAA